MINGIKFLAWHSVGSDDVKATIKQIVKRGFLLPASMRTGRTCKIQVEDYLAGDAAFVFMHVGAFSEIHQENQFMTGYNHRNFYFDAVELIEMGAILRHHDLLFEYKKVMCSIVNNFLGSNLDRNQTAYFLEYAAYMSGVDVNCRDSWSFDCYRELADNFIAGLSRLQGEHRLGEMFDKVYKKCLKIRAQNEHVGDKAISMLESMYDHRNLSNVEIIWEGPLPTYLALHDSPAFRTAQ